MQNNTTTIKTSKRNFERSVENKIKNLKTLEKNSLEWDQVYSDIFLSVQNKLERFADKEVYRLKTVNGIRVDEQEYYSMGLSVVLPQLIEEFNPDTQEGFLKLFFYRVELRFKSIYIRNSAQKRAANNDGLYIDTAIEGEFEKAHGLIVNNVEECVDQEENQTLHIIEEFRKTEPKADIIKCFLIDNVKQRTAAILHVLGAEEYGQAERQAVFRIKNKFKKFVLEQHKK